MLNARFVAGSGIRSTNLKRACIEMTWDDHQSQFAKFLLFDLFALFEGWLAKVLADVGQPGLVKAFQFPTETKPGWEIKRGRSGFTPAEDQLVGNVN
jgi:hypothetical protein